MSTTFYRNLSKKGKGFLISAICVFALTVVFLAFLFLKPHFSKMIDNMVQKEVQFTNDNADVWAEFPGKNDIIIVNNITFLHHRNLDKRNYFFSKKIN